MFNDLIGLKYRWASKPSSGQGTTDCFHLAAEVHRRLGYHDYAPDFAWVFERFTDETFPRRLLGKWLLAAGQRLPAPERDAVVLLPGLRGGALGTVIGDGNVLFISDRCGVVLTALHPSAGYYFRLNK
jgi:hypothetical protein